MQYAGFGDDVDVVPLADVRPRPGPDPQPATASPGPVDPAPGKGPPLDGPPVSLRPAPSPEAGGGPTDSKRAREALDTRADFSHKQRQAQLELQRAIAQCRPIGAAAELKLAAAIAAGHLRDGRLAVPRDTVRGWLAEYGLVAVAAALGEAIAAHRLEFPYKRHFVTDWAAKFRALCSVFPATLPPSARSPCLPTVPRPGGLLLRSDSTPTVWSWRNGSSKPGVNAPARRATTPLVHAKIFFK